jgi:N-acetyl-anhydromuramyl-L-alanine amidase AmpD
MKFHKRVLATLNRKEGASMRRKPLLIILLLSIFAVPVAGCDGGKEVKRVEVPAKVQTTPQGDLNLDQPLNTGGTSQDTIEGNSVNEAKLKEPHAVGGAQTVSCTQRFNSSIYSSRGGVKPTEFVIHYTAGNGTVWSIHSYFLSNRAASATYLLEPSGTCLQEVPESMKPWTQLAANPYAISVEIVTTGWNVSRQGWLNMDIFRKAYLAELMKASMVRNGIPIKRVDPVGCNFVPGYTDHNALECGNDHTDVLPNFPWDVLAQQLSGPTYVITKAARKECNIYNQYTARLKEKGHLDEFGEKRR